MLMVCVFARACVRARASARPSCLPVFEEIEIDERHRLNADRHPLPRFASSCHTAPTLYKASGTAVQEEAPGVKDLLSSFNSGQTVTVCAFLAFNLLSLYHFRSILFLCLTSEYLLVPTSCL